MPTYFILDKPIGKTPLTLLNDCRAQFPEYHSVKIGYAGRLDPMAEGLVLYMVGEENKNRDAYLGLDKEYEIEILFGIETESYDVLGLIKEAKNYKTDEVSKELPLLLPRFTGEIEQHFPPYSSKPFNGKPLYYWARQGKMDQIELPSKKRTINSIEVLEKNEIPKKPLQKAIFGKLELVEGDFNQHAIKEGWRGIFARSEKNSWSVYKLKVNCSSGTYMRTLAHEVGKAMGVGACALSIRRTRIGCYTKPTMSLSPTPNR